MIHAYDKTYLDKARIALGRMFDFAAHELHYDLADFFDRFLSSGIASRFEQGDFTLLVGMSGVELAYEVLEKSGLKRNRIQPNYSMDRSKEYWAGWALAYYQWETALDFAEISRCVPIQEILTLYTPYHEMDIRQFADEMNRRYKAARPETNLKRLRQNAGLSQRELAARSGVPLRTIQQYEQRQKSINKAQAESLLMLAQVLCCGIEGLMEKI